MAEAMRHRSVFSPRSSNRTCGFTASGSPTGFTSRHTVDCQFGLVSRDDTVARNQLSPCGRAPSEASGYFQVLQAHRQSPILGSFESVPEVRVLSSAGITRPHRSYDPVRLPPGPPCSPRRWRCDLRPERASPDYPDHLSNVPCPIPRWIGTGAYVGCFPIPRGLPRFPGGSASTISLSRPAQTSLALRPAGSLNRPRRPLSRGFETAGYPPPLVSNSLHGTSSTGDPRLPHVESRRGAVAGHAAPFSLPAHRTTCGFTVRIRLASPPHGRQFGPGARHWRELSPCGRAESEAGYFWCLSCKGKLMPDSLQTFPIATPGSLCVPTRSSHERSLVQPPKAYCTQPPRSQFTGDSGRETGEPEIATEFAEPDVILCLVTDKGHVAFEIKEMCDEPIAKVVSDLRKTNDDEPKFLRPGYAVQDIAIKTRNKKYRTNYPVELLFYTDGRFLLPPDVIIPRIRLLFENDHHLFRRVWFMGQPGETCECVYQAPENP